MIKILLTLLMGSAFGLLFYKRRVPGGMMVGAICGTFLLSLLQYAYMPYPAKFIAQVTAGAFIGCSVERGDFLQLRSLYKTILIVIGSFLVLNLLSGFLLWRCGFMDLITALLCTIPGGISEVSLYAVDMGADVSAVVILQFIRLCAGIGFFPLWINRMGQSDGDAAAADQKYASAEASTPWRILVTLLIAGAAGWLGKRLGIPAGALIFSILGTLLVKLLLFPVQLPRPIKRFAQALSGSYIGCSIPYAALRSIHLLLLPAVFITVAYMINALLVGGLLHRRFGVSRKEAMLMVTPAGASDMALISGDIGVQSSALIVIHILRMLTAATVFPQICFWVSKLASK